MTVLNQGNLKFETNTIDLTFEDTGDKGIRQQRRNALRAGKLNQGIRQVALVDINGDGHTDIIAPHYLDQLISIGINDGRGSFTFKRLFLDPTDKETIYYLTSLTLLNYAGRKVPDLAIANEYYGIISLFTIGEGTLQLKEKIETGNLSLLRIASDDVNNDGLPDLACTFTPSKPKDGKSAVQIWVNNGRAFSLSESMTSEGFSAYLNTFRSRQKDLPALVLSNIHEGTLTVLRPAQKQ
jgi:hypothetical protein